MFCLIFLQKVKEYMALSFFGAKNMRIAFPPAGSGPPATHMSSRLPAVAGLWLCFFPPAGNTLFGHGKIPVML
jgi:hypothetical protein